MKRKLENVSDSTRSKKPKLVSLDEIDYISASHLYNFLINDPLVDWLKFKKKDQLYNINNANSNCFGKYILQKGKDFETSIINLLKNQHSISYVSDTITEMSLQKTRQLMFDGVPIIHSAPLQNSKTKLQGIADLLIRSDYISNIFNEKVINDEEMYCKKNKLDKEYYYIVVDIKFSTLPLRTDGIHLLNSSNYTAYKAQCLIYTEAVGLIQGYTPNIAFLLGRRNKCTKNGIKNTVYNCLDKLGRISYDTIDKDISNKTKLAVKWLRDLKKHGHKWKVSPPSRKELYPNMCVDSGMWNEEKYMIAEDIGEITQIWYLGVKHRNLALSKGIKSWKDKKCNCKNLQIKGSRSSTIDKILKINRQNKSKIEPKIIQNNLYKWKDKQSNEVFVDFETLNDVYDDFSELPMQKQKDMIFMIGVGYIENDEFQYKNFCCSNNSREEEFSIMNEFNLFMAELGFPKMFCWYAEPNFWKIAEQRQFDLACVNCDEERKDLISDEWQIANWVDMCDVFKNEPIVIKDCYKFGLKNIAKAMYKHKMIKTNLNSDCDNGLLCTVKAWHLYNSNCDIENNKVMNDIKKYNTFDCKVLYEIVEYLRQNHT